MFHSQKCLHTKHQKAHIVGIVTMSKTVFSNNTATRLKIQKLKPVKGFREKLFFFISRH